MDAFELAFQEAQEIARTLPEAVVFIGGWAVWCYNPHLKSRDIDLVIAPKDLWRLRAHLRGRGFVETSGEHLQKRGFRLLHEDTSIDVDIYDTVIGPFRVEEFLAHPVRKRLGDRPIRVVGPTELLTMKLHAARDRRGSEKGAKDLADILALLISEGRHIDWDRIGQRLPRKAVEETLRTALADYRTTSRLYPLSMQEYRTLKRRLARRDLV